MDLINIDKVKAAEIIKTCECIGFSVEEGKGYNLLPYWEASIRDLLRELNKDDDDHSKRRLMGQTQVVGRDLLPLVKHHAKQGKVWEFGLRLLNNLTHPALLLYDEEIPKNKKYLSYYHQLEEYNRGYKKAFVDKELWTCLAERLRYHLSKEWDSRLDDDNNTIARILMVARNILHVPADPSEERRADDDTTLHDRILMVMHMSGFMDQLLLTLSSDAASEYGIYVVEILSLMLREQTGEQLAKTQLARNEDDKVKDERELIRIREREAVLKNIQLQKFPTRHSRFGGTFVVRDMKAPSGNDILCHKPITSVADLSLDTQKKRKRVASNRRPINEEDATRRSTLPVRIILKEFCATLLSKNYNEMMSIIRDTINRGRAEDNDETYYLWALKFFMEFNRHHKFRLSYVRQTMSSNTFHYVQTRMDYYQGMMVTEKDKIPLHSRRMHTALKAYQELLFTLMWMDKDEAESVRDESRNIKSNVFYLPEYRELCLGLLTTYDPIKLSKLYLRDLIETNHLFLKMLEDYSSKSRRIMIKTKGKKRKSKKGSKAKTAAAAAKKKKKPLSSSELEESWSTISKEISSALLSPSSTGDEEESGDGTNANVIPFDAASDVPIDEQKGTAVQRIAVFLHSKKFKEATMLLRASREVWPTDPEYFGEANCEPSDELEVFKSIYMENASLPVVVEARFLAENGDEEDALGNPDAVDQNNGENAEVIGEDEDEEEDEEDEEEEKRYTEKEQELDFRGFVLKYAMARVVANYALLFKDWDTLKPMTLHCIVKMFHRFVFDMGYPALICQASLFLTFQKLLLVAEHRSDLKEVKTFFLHFWPKFAKLCNDKKMFVEILFWKTAREAQEIQDGYAELREGKKKRSDWTREEETELELLVELYKDAPEEVKNAQKLVDYIMERWTWRPRSKRMFINKLTEKELVDPSELNAKKRPPKTWEESEITLLQELYNEYKDSEDIMGNILTKMEIKRSRKATVQKLLDIGAISDKNQVKRKGSGMKFKFSSRSIIDDDDSSDSDTERVQREEGGNRRRDSDSSSDSDKDSDDEQDNTFRGASGPFDEEKWVELGSKLMKKDLGAALRWLRQSLRYYLEDIMEDPDSDESVPLVPIDSECISAVADSDFKQFLSLFGIQSPGQGEAYWRIPSSFKKKDVDMRLDTMEKILNSEITSTSAAASSTNKMGMDIDENSNDGTTVSEIKIKKKPNKRRLPDMSDSDDDDDPKTEKAPNPSTIINENSKDSDSVVQSQSSRKLNGRSRSGSSSSSGSSSDSDSDSGSSSAVSRPPGSQVSSVSTSTTRSKISKPPGSQVSSISTATSRSKISKPSASVVSSVSSVSSKSISKPPASDISALSDNGKNSPSPDLDSSDSESENIGLVVKKKRALIIDSDDED